MRSAKLGTIAEIERSSVAPAEIQQGETYVGLEHITTDGQFVAVASVDAGELQSNKFRFGPEHILYGKLRPYLSKIARPTFHGVCSTDILPIRPGPDVDRSYLTYVLRTPEMVAEATRLSQGANLPRLSPSALADFDIPLPPLEEQRRIASILDAADALRTKRRQALERLDSLTQSIFIDMFGDPVTNPKGWPDDRVLGDLAEVRSGITKGRKVGADEKLRDVPYLAVANVQDGHVITATMKTIGATEDEIKKYALESGDILLTEGGDPDKLGRGAVWDGRVSPCIHQNHIFRARVTSGGMLPEYLSALLGGPRGKRYFLRMAKQTTGIASINMSQLRSFPTLEPPLELQRQYVAAISAVGSQKDATTQSLSSLDSLFAVLQHKAFRGEL